MARQSKTVRWFAARDAVLAQVRRVDFQTFACLWVGFATSFRAEEGYVLARRGEQWAITFGGADSIVGSVRTVYGWMERSPLRRLMVEAEEVRQEAYAV